MITLPHTLCLLVCAAALPLAGSPQFSSYIVPKANSKMVIDGRLTESDWQEKPLISDFRLFRKVNSEMPKTNIWIVQEKDALFIAAECMEEFATLLSATSEHDGAVWSEDHLEFFFDTTGERKSYVQILVNTRGTIADAFFSTPMNGSFAWESHAEVKAEIGVDRWCVEMRIPFSALPTFRSGVDWTFHIARGRTSVNAMQMTSLKSLVESFHAVEAFDFLSGIGGESTGIVPLQQSFGLFSEGLATAWVTLKNTNNQLRTVTVFVDAVNSEGELITTSTVKKLLPNAETETSVAWRCEPAQMGKPVTMRIEDGNRRIHIFTTIVEKVSPVLDKLAQNVLYFTNGAPAVARFKVQNANEIKNQQLKWELLDGSKLVLSGMTVVSNPDMAIRLFYSHMVSGFYNLRRSLVNPEDNTELAGSVDIVYLINSPWEE